MASITVKVQIAWWFKFYAYGMVIICTLTRCQPDQEKLAYWCKRAIRLKVVDGE